MYGRIIGGYAPASIGIAWSRDLSGGSPVGSEKTS